MPQDDILLRYIVDNKFSPAMLKMVNSARRFNKGIDKQRAKLKNLARSYAKTGYEMANFRTAIGVLGGARVMGSIIDESIKFSSAMNLVKSKIAEADEAGNIFAKGIKKIRSESIKWGAKTKFSATQVAEAFAELSMRGLKASESIKTIPGILDLAAAGSLTLSKAAEISQTTIAQFGLKLEDSIMVADKLAMAAASSATDVLNLSRALKNAGVQASMTGQTLDQTIVYIAALAAKGIHGQEAGTKLMNLFKELNVATPKLRENFAKYNIELDKFRNIKTGKIKDFIGLLDEIKAKAGEEAGVLFSKAFNIRAGIAIKILASSKDVIEKMQKAMENSTGASKRMAKILMEGLPGATYRFQSALSTLKITLATALLPILVPAIEAFNSWISILAEANPWILRIIGTAILLVTALTGLAFIIGINIAMKAGWLLLWSGTLKMLALTRISLVATSIKMWLATGAFKAFTTAIWLNTTAMLANPTTWIILGIVALIAIILRIIVKWRELKEAFTEGNFWSAMGVFFGDMVVYFEKIWGFIIKIKDAIASINFELPTSSPTEQAGRATAANKAFTLNNNINAGLKVDIQTEKGTKATPSLSYNNGFQDLSMVG